MGARGPKPKPTAVKKAQGTYRADRAPANEPTAAGRPACPDWLTDDASREFDRLATLLGEMGVLGTIDANALARYCTSWVRWRQSVQMLERAGDTVEGAQGGVRTSPYVAIARDLGAELQRLEQSLGMNPSARSRIEVKTTEKQDDLANFLKLAK
jgi:P27 family predicted phage terminase small subunit